ncbi:MAG TPA: hypothetical protein DEA08_17070 [Planctomycetes bacterium]|nr:hypothetical protein [Planctomycetota bacterium]
MSEWPRLRVIRSGPGRPAWNMAVDEALLECFSPGEDPILRLYRWEPGGLSLGRFQPAGEVELPPGWELVRRPSGGAAIRHRPDEVTYALVGDYARFGKPRAAYAQVHGLIAAALGRLGVRLAPRGRSEDAATVHGLCYAKATGYDLVVGAEKLVGSAQCRRGERFLQHGSIPLRADAAVEGAAGLREVLGREVSPDEVEEALIQEISAVADVVHDALRDVERSAAERLLAEKHEATSWIRSR